MRFAGLYLRLGTMRGVRNLSEFWLKALELK